MTRDRIARGIAPDRTPARPAAWTRRLHVARRMIAGAGLGITLAALFLAEPAPTRAANALSAPPTASKAADAHIAMIAVRGLGSPHRLTALNRPARAPSGFEAFCRAHPRDCVGSARPMGEDATAPVRLTEARLAALDAINRSVNAAVEPMTDTALHGRDEHWSYPALARLTYASGRPSVIRLAGDCEDYVLMKRARLVAAGWPPEQLLITVVRDHDDLGHAVLTVRTDLGDLILDNQSEDIAHWRATGYTFVKRQSVRDPRAWVWLGTPVTEPRAVAATD